MGFMPFRIECLLSLRGPKISCMLAFRVLQFVGRPEQRAIYCGAIIASQLNDACFDDESAKFDQMSGALSALGLPRAHVMPSQSRPPAIVGCPFALERREGCA